MSLSSKFYQHLCQQYPALEAENIEGLIASTLLSPHKIQLNSTLRDKIEQSIKSFESLRQLPSYMKWVQTKWGPQFDPGNQGLFMSYDFHVTPDQNLKLIEINTNASFLGLGWEMFKLHGEKWNAQFDIKDLKDCFEHEMRLAGFGKTLKKIFIVDEKPQEQKLYLEFLLYRELFKSWGLDVDIRDVHDVEPADVIYNRSTDFYFETPACAKIKDLYLNKKAVVSPHPYEYRLLADKENFVEWSKDSFWEEVPEAKDLKEKILSVLPKTQLLNTKNREEIWASRKSFFFKPKRAFGSKMTFKGANISRKIFEELVAIEALAQEAAPAPELNFDGQLLKYDLRCYAYQGKFQGCVGRLYQGQVTNLRTEGGGFAVVNF